MGVMSKLLESQATIAAGKPSPTVGTPSACTDQPQAIPAPTWPSHWPAPAPCPTCGSPGFWIDVYSGGPHCRGCNPPSSPSLVAMPAWVIDGDDGSAVGRRWVRDPRQESRPADAPDRGEFVTWKLPGGETVTALRERIDHTRVVGPHGRYSPPLACGPVGDLELGEWFERLPELPLGGIGRQ